MQSLAFAWANAEGKTVTELGDGRLWETCVGSMTRECKLMIEIMEFGLGLVNSRNVIGVFEVHRNRFI